MGVKVELSKRSQELIVAYLSICKPRLSTLSDVQTTVDAAQLVTWLHDEIASPTNQDGKAKQDTEFLLTSLRSELLHDLFSAMNGDNPSSNDTADNAPWTAKMKFGLLAIAGTLLAGCEGFDSITTMFGLVSLPSFITLIVGLGFSVLSIVFFYSYELVQVSNDLGVSLTNAPKLLDIYLHQMNEIKKIRKKIDNYKLAELSTEELVQLENTISMLQRRFQGLTEASVQFNNALKSNKMQVAKFIVSSMSGLLFFGSGFFAGQSVAMFMAGFLIPIVLPTIWPVILFSSIIGLAALSLYLYFEQVELKRVVSGWFGLDEDKIDKLSDKSILEKEEKKLEILKEKVISTAKLTGQLTKFQHQSSDVVTPGQEPIAHNKSYFIDDSPGTLKTSSNLYTFHPRPDARKKPHLEIPDTESDLQCQAH
jgi:hypothetical protein